MNLEILLLMYDHYTTAKRALGKANDVCQTAHEWARQTEERLESVIELDSQQTYLRDSLRQQLLTLQQISSQARIEEQRSKGDLDTTLGELDAHDSDLNQALQVLRHTEIAKELGHGKASQCHKSEIAEMGNTLYDFADASAVEALRGQLRQMIDDIQELQETLTLSNAGLACEVHKLDMLMANLPQTPGLQDPSVTSLSREDISALHSPSSKNLSEVSAEYKILHEEHLHQMADLLVSLSQHYDHSFTLFKEESSLPPDEIAELQSVVEHDAAQLDDVLTELDERSLELEDDFKLVENHLSTSRSDLVALKAAFRAFEEFDIDSFAKTLINVREDTDIAQDKLDVLRQQLRGLTNHYRGFAVSYDALLLEVERRARYDATIATLLAQTNQTLHRLASEEEEKRDQFVHQHGDTLPGDIWSGITERPVTYDIDILGEGTIPNLPAAMIEAARRRLENSSI